MFATNKQKYYSSEIQNLFASKQGPTTKVFDKFSSYGSFC